MTKVVSEESIWLNAHLGKITNLIFKTSYINLINLIQMKSQNYKVTYSELVF